jgi:putative transposase
MRHIDELHLCYPFMGSRQLRDQLATEGLRVNRKKVQRLMLQMGLKALSPRTKTSQPERGHRVYPYLLRGLKIDRPDQVWCADITYISMFRGLLYLIAIMDWHSRRVLAWRLSNTLDAGFCVEALKSGPRAL